MIFYYIKLGTRKSIHERLEPFKKVVGHINCFLLTNLFVSIPML